MGNKPIVFSEIKKLQPKQLEAYAYVGKKSKIFYGGARGGGKTAFAVYAAVSSSLQFPGLRTGIVRKLKKELMGQIIQGELLKYYPKELYKYNKEDQIAYFYNGSIIYFISLQHPDDVEKEQGIERGLYVLDEGNKLEWKTIKLLEASNRTPEGLVNVRGEPWKDTMIITGNPGGVCDNEIKYRWIEPDYSRWSKEELVQKNEYAFIKAGVEDNKYLGQQYYDVLNALSDHKRRQWLLGDWDTNSGQFFEEWDESVHVVDTLPNGQLEPPADWAKWRGIDMGGGTHPSVSLFITQDPDSGCLYVYNELGSLDVT